MRVTAIAGLLLVASCTSSPAATPEASDPPTPARSPSPTEASSPAEGSITGLFAVDGRELSISCHGTGSPTIVLEPGEGVPASAMQSISATFGPRLRVCSYDRANTGDSEPVGTPRTGDQVVADLHGLLGAAEVPGPYVLVGHSAGGLFVQSYARKHPGSVVGVVAMNPVPPWGPWSTRAFREMTKGERAGETAYYSGQNGESFDYQKASAQLAADPAPRSIAFHLMISTAAQCDSPKDICGRTYPSYEAIMRKTAEEWPRGTISQVEAGHEIYHDDPDAVMAAIEDVLSRAKG